MSEDWEGGTLEESGKLENPNYYCSHGTFVGDPYGPDLMCFWCEMGVSDEDYNAHLRWEKLRADAKWGLREELDRAEAALDRGDWMKAKRYIDSASLLHKRIY